MSNGRILGWCACVVFYWQLPVGATLIASWDMTGQPGDQTSTLGVGLVSGSIAVTADAMVRGMGLSDRPGAGSMNSAGWGEAPSATPADDEDFFSFGFGVSGGAVALDSLELTTKSSNTGPGTLGVFTSLDGFASTVGTISQIGAAESNTSVDLSSLATINTSFTVRLIEIGNTRADGSASTSSSGTFRVSGASFNGSVNPVAVPEPSALLLLGVAGGAAVLNRRVRSMCGLLETA